MCIPVYKIVHQLEPLYPCVTFMDMDFDAPGAHFIKGFLNADRLWDSRSRVTTTKEKLFTQHPACSEEADCCDIG